MKDKKGLGDIVESAIKTIAPKFAESRKDCVSCKRKKKWLNNFNANIFINK